MKSTVNRMGMRRPYAVLLGSLTIFASRFVGAGPIIEPVDDRAFLENLHGCLPKGALFVHVGVSFGSIVELAGGDLLHVSSNRSERSISRDGGETWSAPEPLVDTSGQPIEGGNPSLLRQRGTLDATPILKRT